jgi:hypothetical protein
MTIVRSQNLFVIYESRYIWVRYSENLLYKLMFIFRKRGVGNIEKLWRI